MIFIISFNILLFSIWNWWLHLSHNILKKECADIRQKINLNNRDINTLHFNQKVLQSTVRELHKELKIYGEIKRSRVKRLVGEKEEEKKEI